MSIPKLSVTRRAAAALAVASFLVAGLAGPAQAHKMVQKPGVIHCDKFSMKDYTADASIENPKVTMYDDKGNLLAAKAALAVVINADLVVCVEVNAEAEVDIVLEAVLDGDKNGKKDTLVVRVDILGRADVNAKIKAEIRGQIGVSIAVAVKVDLDLAVKAGEKKSTKCHGKDGYDQY